MKVTEENIVALLKSHKSVMLTPSAIRLNDASLYPYWGRHVPGIYLPIGKNLSSNSIPLTSLMCYEDVQLEGTVLIFDNILAVNFGARK